MVQPSPCCMQYCSQVVSKLAKTPSLPQLLECIAELKAIGFNVPDYPANPKNAEEEKIKATYAKVLGSDVNPVLREVKEKAKKIAWKQNADMTCVASMADKDFFSTEQSHIMPAAGSVKITFTGKDGSVSVLKEGLELQAGEVIDATRMNAAALKEFFVKEIRDCYDNELMMSLHMKATMMEVSDPIIFGHCVKAFYSDVLAKHGSLFDELKVNVNNGIGDVYDKIKGHPMEEEIKADIMKQYETRPGLAMIDSNAGITNLHVPSDVIIDASIPNDTRDVGQMWNKDNKLEEVKCVIPDSSYTIVYNAIVKNCQQKGRFDYTTTGHVESEKMELESEDASEQEDSIPQLDGSADPVSCNICHRDFEGRNKCRNLISHKITEHFKDAFRREVLDETRIEGFYHCKEENCNAKHRQKLDMFRHLATVHDYIKKFSNTARSISISHPASNNPAPGTERISDLNTQPVCSRQQEQVATTSFDGMSMSTAEINLEFEPERVVRCDEDGAVMIGTIETYNSDLFLGSQGRDGDGIDKGEDEVTQTSLGNLHPETINQTMNDSGIYDDGQMSRESSLIRISSRQKTDLATPPTEEASADLSSVNEESGMAAGSKLIRKFEAPFQRKRSFVETNFVQTPETSNITHMLPETGPGGSSARTPGLGTGGKSSASGSPALTQVILSDKLEERITNIQLQQEITNYKDDNKPKPVPRKKRRKYEEDHIDHNYVIRSRSSLPHPTPDPHLEYLSVLGLSEETNGGDISVEDEAEPEPPRHGDNTEDVQIQDFGKVGEVTVTKDDFMLLRGGGTEAEITKRVDMIKDQSEDTNSDYEKEKMQERMASGVAVLKVGSACEVEVNEKKDRVTDALNATRPAVEEAIVHGGGEALNRCLDVVADVTVDNEDQKKGVEIMKYALTKPLSQIDDNAGLDASVIENQVTNARSSKGFDAANEKMTDMINSGITVPAKTSSNLTSEEAHTPLSVDMEDSVEDQAPQGFVKLKLGKKFEEIQVDVLNKVREDWASSQQNTRTVMKPKKMNLNKRTVKTKTRLKGRYSDEDICVATTILYGSKRTYNFLRNKKLLDLPSIRTVYRRLEKFTCPPGKSPQVMRLLEMKIKTLDEAERNVTLSCDEIYLEQKYSYCPRLRRGFGAVKKAQVFMVRGMTTPFKMPIFYDFDVEADMELVMEMVTEVEAAGGRVRAVVCDMGNSKFLGKEGVHLYQKGNHSFPNPARPDDKVWVIPDAVHMIKLLRNAIWGKGGMVYNDGEGDVKICKRDFRELLTHDADSGEFQRLFKFSQSHLDVTSHEKQRVYLAVQTLSESVANAFTLLGKHKHAKFVMTVDRWFHVCDSRVKDHEKPFKAALQVTHEEEQLLCLHKMIDMMQCIRFASGHETKHFQKGVIAATKSIMALYHELKAEGQAFQCTYLLNQDALELFFSHIRGLGGHCSHPRAAQFGSRYRSLFFSSHTMNILSDSTPVSEAKDIWEPSWNVGMEAVKDPPRKRGNWLDVEDEFCLEDCPGQGLQTTDGQQYLASWLASKENMDGMRDPDPGSWLALRGRRRASPKVEGWVLRFDRAFNIFHPGTCGLRTGPNIINLTVQFIQKRPSCKDIPKSIVQKLTNAKYWHRMRQLNDELKHGVKNPNPVNRDTANKSKMLPPEAPKARKSVRDYKKLAEFSC